MKRLALFAAVMVLAAACASAAPQDTSTDSTPAPNSAESNGGGPASDTAAPVAPDFTMALADGGSFTLYDEQKPVYMIFWAEW
ncbi:MAG: hypothetical protein GWP18_03805 [Proteobacteria bacterium]|nr:hypothetical protein [Pseudomonadota bacterium]